MVGTNNSIQHAQGTWYRRLTLHGPNQFLELLRILQAHNVEFVQPGISTAARRVDVDRVQRIGDTEARVSCRFHNITVRDLVERDLKPSAQKICNDVSTEAEKYKQ